MLTALKNRLLEAGPESPALFQAFRLQAAMHRIQVRRLGDIVRLVKGHEMVLIGLRDTISIPFLVHQWSVFFATLQGTWRDGYRVLDFSKPGLHCYRRSGLCFFMPSIAEDDCMEAYLDSYRLRPGDCVWDVGAYAGLTAYWFAKMVGPNGRVFAFEPDDTNYEFLLRNIQRHGMKNVVPVKVALSDRTGQASFCMDGTMSAGLTGSLTAGNDSLAKLVDTITFQDACKLLGGVPDYVKMDIQGGELDAIGGASEFLQENPVHLAIESNHRVNGQFTARPLEEILARAGYRAWSSGSFGELFTWAEPPAALIERRRATRIAA